MSIAEKLIKVAEDMPKVFEAGQKAEYDRFWDAYQNNGQPTDYSNAFQNARWDDKLYTPKYDIISNNTLMSSTFQYSNVTDTLVTIDARLSKGLNYTFYSAEKMATIRKIIVSESVTYTTTFNYCRALEEIRFEGKIGQSIDFHYCTKLSNESVLSIMSSLLIEGGEGSMKGKALTLPLSVKAFAESECDILLMTALAAGWDISFL